MLNVFNLLLGTFLLIAGRKLFWLFVGALGFITGLQLASRFAEGNEATAIIVALVLGVIFALIAVFLQRMAVSAAGFFAGGFVLTALAERLGMLDGGLLFWGLYIVGGILGVILVMLLFDWALITLSSLAGASLILQSFEFQNTAGGIVFFLLVVTGVVIQGLILRREARKG